MSDSIPTRLRAPRLALGLILSAVAATAAAAAPAAEPQALGPQAAARVAAATQTPLLAVTRAGARLVAAGDHGVILLSDDDGRSFRQATAVPVQVLLTSLSFVDAQHGWAAGHDGVVLATADGGETWTLQHRDVDGDKALFAIHFEDAQHGFAVGLFGLAIQTADGGQTWSPLTIAGGERTDRHLFAIFGGHGAPLFTAAESGVVFRSTDGGASWQEIQTTNPGSFWAGTALGDGRWLMAGMRGHLFESRDDGLSWQEIASGTDQSLTAVARFGDGRAVVAGLGGTVLVREAGASAFVLQQRADRAALAALAEGSAGAPLLFGDKGVLASP
ncbi:WD40/YVTN/BNR-like repeat-containing protein [Solimonas flava]|uniref:WD40/YVTN/BNR-like repeat-containing protein n=1 Tax=Solimonas flava TaxID=415849 RepID=UPI000411C988|nr:YCF48-related protein [Solimonas flava]